MSIKLICSDIDGTLLSHDGKRNWTARFLNRYGSCIGVTFCFARHPGRQYASICKLFGPVADCCVSFENGGVIYKDEQHRH